jgi:hypothetical protein
MTDCLVACRVIAADNSCLFNAVAYLMEGSLTMSGDLRQLIASVVMSDPETYSEATLSKPCDEYCKWIMDPSSWGGAIEISILSAYYQTEIAAIDCQTVCVYRFGKHCTTLQSSTVNQHPLGHLLRCRNHLTRPLSLGPCRIITLDVY